MSKWIQKLTRTSRRGMACAMVAALALSTLAQAPSSVAAGKKKPTLNVKKKTLYWNKSGRQNYTLKIKKNKVKTIVATTWKTNKKSVVALSKKKDTSVKLTAKKKGSATITATVKYVPIGKWEIKTAKLTCRVTSKGTAPAKTPPAEPAQTPLIIYTTMPTPPSQPVVTEDPDDTPEPEETADPDRTPVPGETAEPDRTPNPGETAEPDKSQEPTSTPDTPGDSTVTEVVLSASEALLGMEKGKNTITLTAAATDKDGNPLENQIVTWVSDNENVATVKEGTVTAVGGGTAHITATVNNLTSKPCTITVDAEKPVIKEAELSDGRTFFVAFSEPVAGKPSVNVNAEDNTAVECVSQTLSEDGRGMIIVCRKVLNAGRYELTVNGLEDLAGNLMPADSRVSVIKEASVPRDFLCRTEQVPAGQSSFDVYFSIVDQYGEEYNTLGIMSEGVFAASAQTENGMPFKTQVNKQEGYVRVSGSASAFTEGRKIKITLTYSVSGETVIEKDMTITLVDAANKGKAVKIAGLDAASKTMDNEGSPREPVFQLSGTEEDNVFTLTPELLDVFGYKADPSDVIYMIEDESILAFFGTDGAASDGIYTSSGEVTLQALKGGTTKITAYLASDDSQRSTITVKIKSTSLQKITVADLGEGTNGKISEGKITLIPAGTGLTKDDLKYRVTAGEERLENIDFVLENDGIYINITAVPDGEDKPIRFVVYSGEAESEEIIYTSSPSLTAAKIKIDDFKENAVTADSTATTTYRILNRYGEDITKRMAKQPVCGISVPSVIKSATTGSGDEAGTLTIAATNVGTSEITLSMPGNSSVNAKVNVTVVEKAYVKEIRSGTASMDGLILDSKDILYIPLQAYDQYGNEYDAFTNQTLKDESIKIMIDNIELVSSSYLIYSWYDSDNNQVTDNTSKISALGITWNSSSVAFPSPGEVMTISLTSKRNDFKSEPYKIPVNAASIVERLEFDSNIQAALPGATIQNTVKLLDQYGAEVDLEDGQNLAVSILDQEGNKIFTTYDVSPGTTTPAVSANVTFADIKLTVDKTATNSKEYTIQVSIKDSAASTATVMGSYTLLTGSANTLLDKIEISDTATDFNSNAFPLDSQYVYLDPTTNKLTFDCKMYTHYQGQDVEIAWTDSDDNPLISDNNLVWTTEASNMVTVTKESSANGCFSFGSNDKNAEIDEVVTVHLRYLTGDKNLPAVLPKNIKVSNMPPKPQGEYRIVGFKDSSYGTTNYLDKNEIAEISASSEFAIIADDQYGDVYEPTSLYTVISSKGLVTINNSTTNKAHFSIEFNSGTDSGDTDTIKVYVTPDRFYEFTVKKVDPQKEST